MTKIGQKLKELKRQLLKGIQARLRQFLNTEYRTPEEIHKDSVESYISQLNREGDLPTLSSFAGEVLYFIDKDGITYYKNHKTGVWINSQTGEEISQEELESVK